MQITQHTEQNYSVDCANRWVSGEVQALEKRRITEETCRLFGYTVGTHQGKKVQIANYKRNGEVVFQKIRDANKNFTAIGSVKTAGLYGMHLWENRGKMVIVCEGEIDTLTVSQLNGNRFAVVGIPGGAAGAKSAIQTNLDWLLGFESVVFMFDNDEPGQKASTECAALLPPGRAKIARLDMKDPNEMLMAGRGADVIKAMWGARTYQPEGVVAGDDLWTLLTERKSVAGLPFPYKGLNDSLGSMRPREVILITSGSGMGKSTLTRELAFSVMEQGHKIAYIALEESVDRSVLGFMGMAINKPLHLTEIIDYDALRPVFEEHVRDRAVFFDHFGTGDPEALMNKIRFMVNGFGCKVVVLDHISILVADADDERRTLDVVCTKLRMLTEELGCTLLLVSHLRRPPGDKGHEEGGRVQLAQLRGSHALAQTADAVVAIERNQQGEDPDRMIVRVLKNRWSGQTGISCQLRYNRATGRLTEEEFSPLEEESEF